MNKNKTSYQELKSQKEYLKIIAANVVSRFGDSIDAIAFSWMMYQVTGSASMMALIFGLNYIPTILLQPFAGALVDRLPKKLIMILGDIGRGILVLFTIILFHFNILSTGILIAITMINSTLESFREPAAAAIVPQLLDEDKYTIGIGLNNSLTRVAEIAGLILAGGIIGLLGAMGALAIDALTFLVSAVFIGLITLKEANVRMAFHSKTILLDMKDGVRYLLNNRLLMMLTLIGMIVNCALVPISAFCVPYVTDFLHAGPEVLSIIQLIQVVGIGLGAFLTPKLSRLTNKSILIIGGSSMGLAMCSLWFYPYLAPSVFAIALTLVSVFVFGFSIGAINVVFGASVMRLIPKEMMGRIKGIRSAILVATMPVASFACSLISNFVSVPSTIAIAGLLLLWFNIMLHFYKPLKES